MNNYIMFRIGILLGLILFCIRIYEFIQSRIESKNRVGTYIDFGEMAYKNWTNCGFFINAVAL